ncbi:Glycerol-3-phosphate dehydrogenase [Altererythrobacter insulae]|nr:Glycerol-3-phosphate dehydrogenase [Altererythrobacter insulae]
MNSVEQVECIVVGAGVVGLACAAAIAGSGREVIVLEAEDAIGTHCSSRNSEVIHAGIYYEPGSLKAELCVSGKKMLYRYTKDRGIDHKKLGKMIVATSPEQIEKLIAIKGNAEACGVSDLQWLDQAEARQFEPEVTCAAALFSPSTGIIDSHALMLALMADLEEEGGLVVLKTPVTSVAQSGSGFMIETGGYSPSRISARYLVNAAGLTAVDLARTIGSLDKTDLPAAHFAIGHYYRFAGKSPCRHLVYPVPDPGGLGIHLTLDLGGQARFGPDVRWVDTIDYAFDDSKADAFIAAIQRYLPDVQGAQLTPDYTGIRPKISGPNDPNADFRIDGPEAHGIPGLINLFGIESPGLTASLAISSTVVSALNL